MENRYSPPRTLIFCPNDHCVDNFKNKCIATKIVVDEESHLTCFRPKHL